MGDTYPSSLLLGTEWDLAAMENFSTPEINKARVGRTGRSQGSYANCCDCQNLNVLVV
jgi:hypothetical protein